MFRNESLGGFYYCHLESERGSRSCFMLYIRQIQLYHISESVFKRYIACRLCYICSASKALHNDAHIELPPFWPMHA